jgi:hypothetical protein
MEDRMVRGGGIVVIVKALDATGVCWSLAIVYGDREVGYGDEGVRDMGTSDRLV